MKTAYMSNEYLIRLKKEFKRTADRIERLITNGRVWVPSLKARQAILEACEEAEVNYHTSALRGGWMIELCEE